MSILQLDHAVLAVRDLDAGAANVAALGLRDGFRHAMVDWGAEGHVVLLGSTAIELVSAEPSTSNQIGAQIAARAAEYDRPVGICLRSDDLDATCRELGIAAPTDTPAGRYAGFIESMFNPGLPFFVERAAMPPPAAGPELLWVEVSVFDAGKLETWLTSSGPRPDIRVVGGEAGVQRFAIRVADGTEHVMGERP